MPERRRAGDWTRGGGHGRPCDLGMMRWMDAGGTPQGPDVVMGTWVIAPKPLAKRVGCERIGLIRRSRCCRNIRICWTKERCRVETLGQGDDAAAYEGKHATMLRVV
ncbi:hypothetical protein ACHAWF_012830 [Thalassiosira exigua]